MCAVGLIVPRYIALELTPVVDFGFGITSNIQRNYTFLTTPTCLPRFGTEYDLGNHSSGRHESK